MADKTIGDLQERDSLFLHVHAGSATGSDGSAYEMSYSMAGTPIIRSGKTGRYWTLSWQQALELAVAAGIDTEGG